MSFTEIINSNIFYIYVGIVLGAMLIQNIIMMRIAKRRAGKISMDHAMLRKGFVTGISISILPCIPVILVFIALVPILGNPTPWLRLSVVGSAGFEATAAAMGASAVGEEASAAGITITGWIAAIWVMSCAGCTSALFSTLLNRPMQALYNKVGKFDMKLVLALGAGAMAGIMAYATVTFGLGDLDGNFPVFLASFLVGWLINIIAKKTKQKWLGDFQMAFSMIVAMAVACILF